MHRCSYKSQLLIMRGVLRNLPRHVARNTDPSVVDVLWRHVMSNLLDGDKLLVPCREREDAPDWFELCGKGKPCSIWRARTIWGRYVYYVVVPMILSKPDYDAYHESLIREASRPSCWLGFRDFLNERNIPHKTINHKYYMEVNICTM